MKISDDYKHIAFREYLSTYLGVTIAYYIWYFIYVFRVIIEVEPSVGHWNPYWFGGMPLYGSGRGVHYWNHIEQVMNFLRAVFFNVVIAHHLLVIPSLILMAVLFFFLKERNMPKTLLFSELFLLYLITLTMVVL